MWLWAAEDFAGPKSVSKETRTPPAMEELSAAAPQDDGRGRDVDGSAYHLGPRPSRGLQSTSPVAAVRAVAQALKISHRPGAERSERSGPPAM
jgi:hypothetical protein